MPDLPRRGAAGPPAPGSFDVLRHADAEIAEVMRHHRGLPWRWR